jgi:hypothetical protein
VKYLHKYELENAVISLDELYRTSLKMRGGPDKMKITWHVRSEGVLPHLRTERYLQPPQEGGACSPESKLNFLFLGSDGVQCPILRRGMSQNRWRAGGPGFINSIKNDGK